MYLNRSLTLLVQVMNIEPEMTIIFKQYLEILRITLQHKFVHKVVLRFFFLYQWVIEPILFQDIFDHKFFVRYLFLW